MASQSNADRDVYVIRITSSKEVCLTALTVLTQPTNPNNIE